MRTLTRLVTTASVSLLLVACAGTENQQRAETGPRFGGQQDMEFAGQLWQAMNDAKLVGTDRILTNSYTGVHPHGAILQTVESTLSVGGSSGVVLVKHNFGGETITKEAVANDYGSWIKAITVMYQRPGYDPDNNNWFWAKYLPDGSLDKNPKGMQLAGRVAKGNTEAGCIACHTAAPGGDLVFTNDRYAMK